MKIVYTGLDEVAALTASVPELDQPTSLERLRQRVADREFLALLANVDNHPVGFKLGYAIDSTTFYSWLGGVIPSARQQGIADQLRVEQECWAKQQGYQCIQVKSMNQYPAMLQFLITRGYQIIGYKEGSSPTQGKILFSKNLR